MTDKIYYRFSSDTGNGSMKMHINGKKVIMPSVVYEENRADEIEKTTFLTKTEKDEYFKDFLDHLYVSISSASLSNSARYFVGNAALDRQANATGFDINDPLGKSQSDLPLILNLSTIAGQAVKDAYQNGKDMKSPIEIHVGLTLALPISEGRQMGVIDNYKKRYTESTHVVTFHNFADPITVTVHIDKCFVGLEGEVAQVAIRNSVQNDPDLIKKMTADLRKHYPELKSITENQLAKVPSVVLIDIGGKTTDISVIVDGKVNRNASGSLMRGYDLVLQQAMQDLNATGYNFASIGDLKRYLAQPASPFLPTVKQKVEKIVNDRMEDLNKEIVDFLSQTLRKAGASIQVGFVTGGGAIPLGQNSNLRSEIADKMKSFNAGNTVPVIFVPNSESQWLNADGLELIAKALKY